MSIISLCALHVDGALLRRPSKLQFNVVVDVCNPRLCWCYWRSYQCRMSANRIHYISEFSVFEIIFVLSHNILSILREHWTFAVKIFTCTTCDGAAYNSTEAECWCQMETAEAFLLTCNCIKCSILLTLYYHMMWSHAVPWKLYCSVKLIFVLQMLYFQITWQHTCIHIQWGGSNLTDDENVLFHGEVCLGQYA